MPATLRFLSLLTSVINRLLVLALALALAAGLWQDDGFGLLQRLLGWLAAHPNATAGLILALAVLNLDLIQFVLFLAASAPSRAYITSRTPGGNTRVALGAVRKALKSTAAQVPEISRCRIRVNRSGRNRYRVHIRYFVNDVLNAGSAAEHLRLVLKRRFSDLVVLDPRDRVDFDLDLAGILPKPARVQEKLPAPREDSFHGPVYPVGGDMGN